MDLLYFLDDKLRFIERLYSRAVEPFSTIKRKIEEGERSRTRTPLVTIALQSGFRGECRMQHGDIMLRLFRLR
jgi:hypothetical protein